MIHNYSIEIYNITANRWELVDTARTLDEAFDVAEKYIGYGKDYDTVAILDMQGFIVWDSDGFRQGEGFKLPTLDECDPDPRMKNHGMEAQQEAEFTAQDGSC